MVHNLHFGTEKFQFLNPVVTLSIEWRFVKKNFSYRFANILCDSIKVNGKYTVSLILYESKDNYFHVLYLNDFHANKLSRFLILYKSCKIYKLFFKLVYLNLSCN